MKNLPTATTPSPTAETQLTATVPPSGKTSPTGKPRGFVVPQNADTEASQDTAALLGRVADCIRENGITPEQDAALRAAARAVPADTARPLIDAIDAERNRTPGNCPALDGECVSHEDDHGVTIHFGPEHRASVAGLADVLTNRLVKWDNDAEPTLSIGEEDLDLDGTTQLIEVVEKQLANLRATRQHLLSAIQQHRLDTGVPLAVVRSDWERVRLDHNPGKPADRFAYSPAGPMRPIAAVEYNRDTTTPEAQRAYLDRMVGPNRVEYTPEVADALTGFEAIRRADPDPKALEFWDEVEQQVIASDDPVTCLAELAKLLAAEELAAFISQHDGQIFTHPPEKGFYSWAARVNGRLTVVVPEDHDPVLTLRLVREQVAKTAEAQA